MFAHHARAAVVLDDKRETFIEPSIMSVTADFDVRHMRVNDGILKWLRIEWRGVDVRVERDGEGG